MFNPKKSFSRYLNTKKLYPVAIDPAKERTKIILNNGRDKKDITDLHTLISLKPFAIAINVTAINLTGQATPSLQIYQEENKLGELLLKRGQTQHFSSITLKIFEAALSPGSYPMATKAWNLLMLSIKNVTDKKSKNFIVPPAELMKLFVYTLKPRPVFLVSIEHENGFDAFPIDIFGKISQDHIILSIRSTSAAIPFIRDTRKLCACSVPFDVREKVYKFGRHHAGGVLPPELNTGEFIRSHQLQIPIPEFAVSVQELLLEDSFVKGAHTQFIARVVNSYRLSGAQELAHTPWFNPNYF